MLIAEELREMEKLEPSLLVACSLCSSVLLQRVENKTLKEPIGGDSRLVLGRQNIGRAGSAHGCGGFENRGCFFALNNSWRVKVLHLR